MIEGHSIRLRPWLEDDLPTLSTLRNDIALQAQLLTRVRGNRLNQVREWLELRSEQADCLMFIIAGLDANNVLGFIQVSNLDYINGHADLGICMISQSRGKGFGGEAIDLFACYLRDQWHLRKINLRVRSDNVSAIRCYEKVGFQHCGQLRKHIFIDGCWHDVKLMERFLVELD